MSQAADTSTPFVIWERSGITEHMGGLYATRRLIEACQITPGQTILNLGCGTGYTACRLGGQDQTQVVAADLNPQLLHTAFQRALKTGTAGKILFIQANAHKLPFAANNFDGVIVESLLVFCEARQIVAEIYRVLRPGGVFGANELTFLRPPSAELLHFLDSGLGMHPYDEHGWHDLFCHAGFEKVVASIYRVKLREQIISHLKVDGLKTYLLATLRGLADPSLRRTFINLRMLKAARELMPYVGYGLYLCTKV